MPQAKIKIERISRREVHGDRGSWWSASFLAEDKWYSSPTNDFVKDWKEGQVVEFEYVEKPSRDPNKPFLNIVNPNKKGAPRGNTDSQVLDEIKNSMGQLMMEILAVKELLQKKAKPEEEAPF